MSAEVTIDFSAMSYDDAQEVTSVEQDGITVTFDKGTNKNTPKYYANGTAVRVYGGGTMTVPASLWWLAGAPCPLLWSYYSMQISICKVVKCIKISMVIWRFCI